MKMNIKINQDKHNLQWKILNLNLCKNMDKINNF